MLLFWQSFLLWSCLLLYRAPGKPAFLDIAKSPSLVLLLHLPSRTVSTSATIHQSHKNSHISHFQSHQNVQVTYRWLEEPNKWDTQVNKPESKQTSRKKCFFSTFTAISLSLNLCFSGHDCAHHDKPYIDRGTVVERQYWARWQKWKQSTVLWLPIYLLMFYTLNWVTILLIHRYRVYWTRWNDYGRSSLLITAVTTCTFLPQSSIFRPRSVLGYRAGKWFMYHWNIDVICRKISDTTRILISLTNHTSRGNSKGMIVHALGPNLDIWLSNV